MKSFHQSLRIFAITLLAVGISHAAALRIEPPDRPLFDTVVVPLVRQFITNHHLAFPANFTTNDISSASCGHSEDPRVRIFSINLKKEHSFTILTSGTIGEVWHYNTQILNLFGVFNRVDTNEMRFLASQPNRLNKESALKLCQETFLKQGHDPKNFRPPEFQQIVWGENPKDPIVLPFYEATWVRNDVTQEMIRSGSSYPNVRIFVDGLIGTVAHYGKYDMGIGSDFGPMPEAPKVKAVEQPQ